MAYEKSSKVLASIPMTIPVMVSEYFTGAGQLVSALGMTRSTVANRNNPTIETSTMSKESRPKTDATMKTEAMVVTLATKIVFVQ